MVDLSTIIKAYDVRGTVPDQLDESIALYLEAGEVGGDSPSTIVDSTLAPMRVVRAGAISIDALREVVPSILDVGEEPTVDEPVDEAVEPVDEESEPMVEQGALRRVETTDPDETEKGD